MMRGFRTAGILTSLLLLAATAVSASPPPLPSSFWGVFTMNGARVAQSGELTAHIGDVACGKATLSYYQGATYYSISVKGDIPDTPIIEGGVEGDVIHFWLNGVPLATTGIWHGGGTPTMLDLVETSPHRSTAMERLSLPVIANEYWPPVEEADSH